ncbi:MAG: OmpA family protein [Bacteroidia bacterium]
MKITKQLSVFFIAVFVFSMSSVSVKAQKNFTKDADMAFQGQQYFNAIELYKKAYAKVKKKDEKARIIFQTAECYKDINDTKQAESWYQKAVKAKYPDPKATLYLADMKKINGKYDEALIEYNNYKQMVPSDPRGEDGAKSCELAQKWKDNPTRYDVENMSMINSRDEDFAPAYGDRKHKSLIFSSTRPGAIGDKTDLNTGQTYSDLYTTTVDKNGKWSTPVSLAAPINSEYNEGAAEMDNKDKMIYFTRCGVVKNSQAKCQLYVATKKGSGWGDPELLPFCVDSFAFGHPSISEDGMTLFFSSDMPGGQGGKDIWFSKYDKKAKKWGNPINAGPEINTPQDEMYPYIRDDNTLYFSSNGHLGMGGLDIYSAQKIGDDKWGKVTNMLYPINSSGDDFAIIFDGKNERGYLSSNRDGGKGSDDIYSFVLPPLIFTIQGVVADKESKQPIPNATVKLLGSDGSSVEATTDKAGMYKFAENGKDRYVNPNTSYVISASATDFIKTANSSAKETTVGVNEAKIFIHNFELQSAPKGKEISFPQVLYDVNKATLRPESKDSLNALYQTLVDNPTITIELDANTDQRGSRALNIKLSQARAQSCVSYLISKGIDSVRMTPKGWAFDRPLVSMKEINKMKTKEEKEAAFQKNRRTSFRVLSTDYHNPKDTNKTTTPTQIIKVKGETEDYDHSDENGGSTPAPTTPSPTNNNNATTPKK